MTLKGQIKEDALISIVTASYNAEKYIEETIISVINQTYKNWEWIIVDDGSEDKTVEIIESYSRKDKRIHLMQMPYNSGRPAPPRNQALMHARGDIIAFIDADDLWHPSKLDYQIDAFSKYNVSFLSTRAVDFYNHTGALFYSREVTKNDAFAAITFDMMLNKNRIIFSSVISKKNCLKNLIFDESNIFRAVEDYDLWLKILHAGFSHVRLQKKLVGYRHHSSSISRFKLIMFYKALIVKSKNLSGKKLKLLYLLKHTIAHAFLSVFYRRK